MNDEKIKKVEIINENNIKTYNVKARVKNVINILAKKQKIAQEFYNVIVKYKKNKTEQEFFAELETNKKLQNILLEELNKKLEHIEQRKKQEILQKAKEKLQQAQSLKDLFNLTDVEDFALFFVHLPLYFLDISTKTLTILNYTIAQKTLENTIQRAKELLNIQELQPVQTKFNEISQKNKEAEELQKQLAELQKQNEQLRKTNKELVKTLKQTNERIQKLQLKYNKLITNVKRELKQTKEEAALLIKNKKQQKLKQQNAIIQQLSSQTSLAL